MRKNISISNFNPLPKEEGASGFGPRGFTKIPLGVLLVLILAVVTESFIYVNRADLITDYWNKFLINEHSLIDQPKDYDYLIMGDSLQKTGVDPTAVSSKVLNLGLPGAKPLGQYILLGRYLEKHKPPRVVFLFIDPEYEHDSLFVILRYFVNIPEFLSAWKDLIWRERQIFMMRYWASLDMRKVGLTQRDKYPYPNAVFVEQMKKNQGYMPSTGTDSAINDDYFLTHKDRRRNKISVTERDKKYLDKFVDLALSNNIKVVFLGYLVPKELHDICEKSGFNSDYLSFFAGLKLKYTGCHFAQDPILYLDNANFGDASHLNKGGVKMYTEYFKNQVFIPNIN